MENKIWEKDMILFLSQTHLHCLLHNSVIITFLLMSIFHVYMGRMVFHEWLPSISVFSYALAGFLFFRSLLIASFNVFAGHPFGKLLLTLKALQRWDQALSSIPSAWPIHTCPLSWKSHSENTICIEIKMTRSHKW